MEPKIPLPGPKSPLLETCELSSRFFMLFSLPHLASYPRNILLYCFSLLIEVMLRNVIGSLVYYMRDLIFFCYIIFYGSFRSRYWVVTCRIVLETTPPFSPKCFTHLIIRVVMLIFLNNSLILHLTYNSLNKVSFCEANCVIKIHYLIKRTVLICKFHQMW